MTITVMDADGHKPGVLRISVNMENSKEFCANSEKNYNKVVLVHYSNICVKQLLTG